MATRFRPQTNQFGRRQIENTVNPYWFGTETYMDKRQAESPVDIIIQKNYEKPYPPTYWAPPEKDNDGKFIASQYDYGNDDTNPWYVDGELVHTSMTKRYETVLNDADSKALEARGWRPQRYG
ncbi:hypothetical protein FBUS_04356 [Fasciolopsis buskii]|uniref:Uncharacterized protein n=1 Tax=Fasciolopsis buskii TaxID=27845 RepID=A0A8E0S1K8_9TREM|nr:hypothetical protein FBUS_04356 [Fasciolopsis buski]